MISDESNGYKVAVFIGTRPEGVKMAPVIRALEDTPGLNPLVISTGQHKELLDQVTELFGIRVQEDLAVMKPGQQLAELTARLMTAVDGVLEKTGPDLILVQGDTTTVLVAALAAFYRKIPLGHVEAGLRTRNIWSPFPEEVNRTLVSPLVDLHFAPTETARENLRSERVPEEKIFVTGNTVIDALLMEVRRQEEPEVRDAIGATLGDRFGLTLGERNFILVTGHRRENFGEGFQEICRAIAGLARNHPEMDIVYPVHLNPNVQEPVQDLLGSLDNVHLLPPVPYDLFLALLNACEIVLTDSGGVQEEAPALGKPVLVMRDTTERPEGVEAGTAKLVGTSADAIMGEAEALLTDPAAYRAMAERVNPYGDGKAAKRIAEAVGLFLKSRD